MPMEVFLKTIYFYLRLQFFKKDVDVVFSCSTIFNRGENNENNFFKPFQDACIKSNLSLYKNKYGDKIPFKYHSKIRSEEACLKSTIRIINLAKKTNSRLHVFHLSTKIEAELFSNNQTLENKKITSEVCIHHLSFNQNDYKEKQGFIKWNPSVKSEDDQLGLWKSLNDDRIDVIATDHAPHTYEEKNNS